MISSAQESIAALRRFALRRAPQEPQEQCELCSAALAAEHQHLVEPATRRLVCACDACAILFDHDGQTKYRRVPRRGRLLADFRLSDAQWDALDIPTALAFFLHSSPAGRVAAVYPSPAGPTESLLELAAWDDIVRDNPALAKLQPDVEALLVNRLRGSHLYCIAPIDQCYRLVGLIRKHWQGFSGGSEVWQAVDEFFQQQFPVGRTSS